MKVLCIGDIVGKPGRKAIKDLLSKIREEFSLSLVIANAENSAGGSGLTGRTATELFNAGCNILTLGDHAWDQKELEEHLDKSDHILRPANFPIETPGKGWCVHTTSSGLKVGVVNLLGRVFIRYNVDCPFRAFDKIFEEIKKETSLIIVDIHAEATSEKVAFGHYVDGRATGVFGTHTHVQTADEKVLSKGTAYITDVGMTGPCDSVIGQNKENIIKRYLLSMPVKFSVAEDDIQVQGVIIDVDEKTGKAISIERLQRKYIP